MHQSIVRGTGLRMAQIPDSALAPWPSPGVGEELWIIATPGRVTLAPEAEEPDHPGSGALVVKPAPDGDDKATVPLPLKHTEVRAAITGYVGTVDVTQQFQNPFDEKIEAVYMFPLPEKAAVSEFVMTIGNAAYAVS